MGLLWVRPTPQPPIAPPPGRPLTPCAPQDPAGAAAAREAPLWDPHGGAGRAPLPPTAALRRRQQPPELPRPAGCDPMAAP